MFFPVLLLLFFAAGTVLSVLSKPQTSANLTKTTNTEGSVTITSYTDREGRAVTASDKGYASIRTTKDQDGHTVLEEYLDPSGDPVLLSARYAAVQYGYTDGLNTLITYLDETGKPAVISNGYDTIRRSYNEKRLAETDTYWIHREAENGQAEPEETKVMRREGYAEYRRGYNDRNQAIILEYRDLNGAPVNMSAGYARRVRTFDDSGKVSEERYYGADNRPAVLSLGQSGYRRSYDEQGRTVETVYTGPNGAPINTSRGYSRVSITYTDEGTKTQYYDVDGNPVTIGKNQYGTLSTGGQSIYLNEDGEIMRRLDNVLDNNPYLVLTAGILLTVMAACLRGKARWVFLVLYFGFIIYMTMVYREAGDSRGRLELFYSYRRMLRNPSLRQQIVNNIWLFIPFGATICGMLPGRSRAGKVALTVLICAAVSAAIESTQYFAGIGLCEADDVVSNGLGGLMGAAVAAVRKSREGSRNT